MFVIIGLGNPGEQYEKTRHNVGFMAVDKLDMRFGGGFKKGNGPYIQSKIFIGNQSVLLVKPMTYMNLSGQAVRKVVDYYKLTDISTFLIVMDDFHLPLGTIRLRPSGSAGGQKGLNSILHTLQSNNIARLRIGIGNDFRDASSHVLSPFKRHELKLLPEVIDWAANAIESFVVDGIDKTMSFYNKNILDDSP